MAVYLGIRGYNVMDVIASHSTEEGCDFEKEFLTTTVIHPLRLI